MQIDGEKFRKARLAAGFTQQSLGELIGITQSHLSKIEHGVEKPGLQTVLRTAEALGVYVEDLLAP